MAQSITMGLCQYNSCINLVSFTFSSFNRSCKLLFVFGLRSYKSYDDFLLWSDAAALESPIHWEEVKMCWIKIEIQTSIALGLSISDLSTDISSSKEEQEVSLPPNITLIGSWSPPNSSSKFWNVKSTSGMLKSSRQTSSSHIPRSWIFWDHSCKHWQKDISTLTRRKKVNQSI